MDRDALQKSVSFTMEKKRFSNILKTENLRIFPVINVYKFDVPNASYIIPIHIYMFINILLMFYSLKQICSHAAMPVKRKIGLI